MLESTETKKYDELMRRIISSVDGDSEDLEVIGVRYTSFGMGLSIGNLTNMVMDPKDDIVVALTRFVRSFSELDCDEQKELIKRVKLEIFDEYFENEILNLYKEHRQCSQCDYTTLISDFVLNFSQNDFSKVFQDAWKAMQPYTLEFGNKKLVVGGTPNTVIDQLISALDFIDKKGPTMPACAVDELSSNMKNFLEPWSAGGLAINQLIESSKDCEVDSAEYLFVKNIVLRVGVDNLPEAIVLAYKKIFPKTVS
jgi:hypothetical protein